MEGYGRYCPIALGAEIFAERWTPIILRNLMVGGDRFGDLLAGAPGIPRSVLTRRLRTLEREGVVTRSAGRYRLTASGAELAQVCTALGTWGARWRESRPEHHDPYLALWSLAHLVDRSGLPQARVVVRFDITGGRGPHRYWLVVGSADREVCAHDPGHGDDAVVTCAPAALIAWHCGRLPLGAALRAGTIAVTGPPWAVRMVAGWGRLSPFADVAPAGRASSSADDHSHASPDAGDRAAGAGQTSSARTAEALLTTSISRVPSAASPSPAAGKA